MVECAHGHPNPAGWQLCGECGSPLDASDDSEKRWYRTKWAILAAGVVVTVAISAAIIAVVGSDDGRPAASKPTSDENAAILDWWSQAREPFTTLQQSLADSQRALATADRPAMQEACQQMHDSAAVELPAHLPAPTALLTSEVSSAVEDAHAASNMCMAVLAGSSNSYDGEFSTQLDQAEKHLVAARELVQGATLNAP